jgi:hypothetical protein
MFDLPYYFYCIWIDCSAHVDVVAYDPSPASACVWFVPGTFADELE